MVGINGFKNLELILYFYIFIINMRFFYKPIIVIRLKKLLPEFIVGINGLK